VKILFARYITVEHGNSHIVESFEDQGTFHDLPVTVVANLHLTFIARGILIAKGKYTT